MTKLSFVNFRSVEKWHIDQYLRETLKGKYPMVPLSKILMPIRERVSSSEYSKEILSHIFMDTVILSPRNENIYVFLANLS